MGAKVLSECDFSGYATKNDLKCADGRVIMRDAFKDNDGQRVPLVWNHMHNDPNNVLGHALLQNRSDGVYAYCFLNDTPAAQNVKVQIQHGDISSLSICANQLKQRGNNVLHGTIREVSLVLAGANPGALIDNLSFAHSDGTYEEIEDEAIIYTGLDITTEDVTHADEETTSASDGEGKTIKQVFESMSEEQKNVVYFLVGQAAEGAGVQHSDDIDEEGDEDMKKNVFDTQETVSTTDMLTHSQLTEIFDDAKRCGSLKESFLAHAQTYGIENIDILFPDARTVTNPPDYIKRDMEWVAGVISGTKHVPFSRIKSTAADITADEARARGYIKGKLKKEEVIKLLKRVTTPTTIYKKQKLDRDDIIDITDLDVVSWLKSEMRMMLDEEIARAILVGDGRDADSDDKINEENIRPIWTDDELYTMHVDTAGKTGQAEIEGIMRAMIDYEGSGSPTLYTTAGKVLDWMLLKDTQGRYIYETEAQLASKLGVSRIVKVPILKDKVRSVTTGSGASATTTKYDLVGIIVNLRDYTTGADKGGQISMFDDFDIDYNQYKYLMETRMSGCLTHPKSALVIETKQTAAG